MSQTSATPTAIRRTFRFNAVGLAVATATIIAAFVHGAVVSSAPPVGEARSSGAHRAGGAWAASPGPSSAQIPLGNRGRAATGSDGALTEADGALPHRATVSDDAYPGIANLDPALLDALHAAATAAGTDGVDLYVTSGWRSEEYQDQLLREAIARYGSEREAGRWVSPADTSSHVTGDAVDVGPDNATAWLAEYGARYGLCQIYRNEPWHYELRPEAIDRGCPAMYADPGHGPGLRR